MRSDLTLEQQVVRAAAARALRPPPRIRLSEWAERHRVLPTEVSGNSGRWSNALFPFLVEIMDCLTPHHPAETVTFCKSSQVGGTETGLNWMFAIADLWPGPTLMVHPTIQAAQEWVREKLAPSIRATDRIRERVIEQKSRDGASTTLFKSFPGGYWAIVGANSAPGLSAKSIRFVVKEEWDRWPKDVDDQGDPDELVKARQTSYHASGKAKTFQASTPTILGASRIWEAYEKGDKRRYNVPCPECGHYQVLHFFPDQNGKGGLIFDKQPPYRARYACEACGVLIEHHRKHAMLAGGIWIAEHPQSGLHPSFHISALYSPVTTWDKMAEAFVNAKDDPQKLKAFVNLWLGEPWEEKGEAPEWQALFARREDRPQGVVPRGGLILTGAADVQADGIFYEVVAWGRERISWTVDIGFLPGPTADPDGRVWKALEAIQGRRYPLQGGGDLGLDLFGVDAGYNSNAVYSFVRRLPKAFALKGRDGWFAVALGTPSKVDVTFRGRLIRRGVQLWPVGTWGLKAQLYADLRKIGRVAGQEADPPGYCNFATFQDERYFQMLTAEYLAKREVKGRIVQEWRASGPNHYLDCRVYNMALAEHLGISRMTESQWARLAAGRLPQSATPDLFMAAVPVTPEVDEAPVLPAEPPAPVPQAKRPAIRRRPSSYVMGWKQ